MVTYYRFLDIKYGVKFDIKYDVKFDICSIGLLLNNIRRKWKADSVIIRTVGCRGRWVGNASHWITSAERKESEGRY